MTGQNAEAQRSVTAESTQNELRGPGRTTLSSACPRTDAKENRQQIPHTCRPALCGQAGLPHAGLPGVAGPARQLLPGGAHRPGAGGGVSGFPGVGEVGERREGRRSVSAGGPPQGAGLQLLT